MCQKCQTKKNLGYILKDMIYLSEINLVMDLPDEKSEQKYASDISDTPSFDIFDSSQKRLQSDWFAEKRSNRDSRIDIFGPHPER